MPSIGFVIMTHMLLLLIVSCCAFHHSATELNTKTVKDAKKIGGLRRIENRGIPETNPRVRGQAYDGLPLDGMNERDLVNTIFQGNRATKIKRRSTKKPSKMPISTLGSKKGKQAAIARPSQSPLRKSSSKKLKADDKYSKPSIAPSNQQPVLNPPLTLRSMGSIRQSVFYTNPDQPISASLPVFTNSAMNFYASCSDLRDDLLNAVSIKVNKIILDNSIMSPMIFMDGPTMESLDVSSISEPKTTAQDESSYGTNNQVKGVDQADIVKSTATHSFAAYGDKLVVWDVISGTLLSVTLMPTLSHDKAGSSKASDRINPRPGFQRVQITGLLMDGDRLTVVVTGYQFLFLDYFYSQNITDYPILNDYASTSIRIYDLSNIPTDGGELVLVASQHLDGSFQDARSINNTAYIITTTGVNSYYSLYYPLSRFQFDTNLNSSEYIEAATKLASETYIPQFVDRLMNELISRNGNCEDITHLTMFLAVSDEGSNETSSVPSIIDSFMDGLANIFTFDMLQTPSVSGSSANITFHTTRSFIPNSYSSNIYASTDVLVLSTVGYNYYSSVSSWQECSYLLVFNMTGGISNVHGLGSAVVPGYLINSYAMDIWDNHLRVASTQRAQWGCNETKTNMSTYCEWVQMTDSDNMVSVLSLPTNEKNEGLNLVGYIDGLGDIGESIYAVRFMENRGFMSTFFRKDPLYALDLSDPTSPKVAGYLKIPGYSSYLHPFNSDGSVLIAVGQNADANGVSTGLQINLFDVSNIESPSLLQSYEIEYDPNVYSSSDASYDPESFRFLDQSKKLILPVSVWNYSSYDSPSNFDGFYIFDVSTDTGITKSFEVNHVMSFNGCWYAAYIPSRSLVHNGVLTTIKGHTILAHDLTTAVDMWSLNLDTNNTDCGGYWVY